MTVTIGIRREDKNEWERRAPLIPSDIAYLRKEHGLRFVVQPSPIRSYPDAASSGNIPLAGNTNDDGIQVLGGTLNSSAVWREVAADFILTSSATVATSGELTIESDVNVRFDHGTEPLAERIYRTLRRLFMGRLSV